MRIDRIGFKINIKYLKYRTEYTYVANIHRMLMFRLDLEIIEQICRSMTKEEIDFIYDLHISYKSRKKLVRLIERKYHEYLQKRTKDELTLAKKQMDYMNLVHKIKTTHGHFCWFNN